MVRLLTIALPSKHSSWRRYLEDFFRLHLQKTSSRRLDEDEYILISHTSSEDVFKTSSTGLAQDQYIHLVHTSSRCLQDVFKKSSRCFAKTSSRRLANTSWRYLQDVLKTYHQVKLFLLISLWEVLTTFVKRTANTVAYRRNTSEKFMVCVEIFSRVIKISQVLVFHFTTPFSACL